MHIIAGRLAYLIGRIIIEDIILNLESNPNHLTKQPCIFHHFIGRVDRYSPGFGTGCKESGCLLTNHIIINFFGKLGSIDIGQLDNLTFCKILPQPCHQINNTDRTRHGRMLQTGSQHIVSHQYRYLIIIDSIHRRLPASLIAFVHHIVMHQTCRVKQLQRKSGMKCRMIDFTE